jgi:hypothetical protein
VCETIAAPEQLPKQLLIRHGKLMHRLINHKTNLQERYEFRRETTFEASLTPNIVGEMRE